VNYKLSKGMGEGVIIVIILLGSLISLVLGISAQMWTVHNKVARIEDFSAMVQTHAIANHLEEHYINQSLVYASWESSYQLGKIGGTSAEWKEGKLPKIDEISWNLAQNITHSKYFSSFESKECIVNFKDEYQFEDINFSKENSFEFFANKTPIEVSCSKNSATAKYYLNASRLITSSGNRYFHLYDLCYNLSNWTDFFADQIEDPSGNYYGIFALPVEGMSDSLKNTFTPECSHEITDSPGSVIEAASFLVAQLIAEIGYRGEVYDAYKKSKDLATLPDGVEIDLENEAKLRWPSLSHEILSLLFPQLMGKLGDLRANIQTLIDGIETQIDATLADFQNSGIIDIAHDLSTYLKDSLTTVENIQKMVDDAKTTADNILNSFDFVDSAAKTVTDVGNDVVDTVGSVTYSDFMDGLKMDISTKITDFEQQTVNKITNPIEDLLDKANIDYGRGASASSLSDFADDTVSPVSEESLTKDELKKQINDIIDSTDLTDLTVDFTDSIKDEAHKKVTAFVDENIKEKINDAIEKTISDLNETLRKEIKEQFKEQVTTIIRDNLEEPIKEQVRSVIQDSIRGSIDSLLTDISEQINQQIDQYLDDMLGINSESGEIDYTSLVGTISENCALPDDFSLLDSLKDEVEKVIKEQLQESLSGVVDQLKSEIKDATENTILTALDDTIDSITSELETEILSILNEQTDAIVDYFVNALDGPISDSINQLLDNLEEQISLKTDDFINSAVDQVNPIAEEFDSKVSNIKNIVKNAADLAIDLTYENAAATETGYFKIKNAASFGARLKEVTPINRRIKTNIITSIETSIHTEIFEPVLVVVNAFEPIDEEKVNNLQQNLLDVADTVMEASEILNDASEIKAKIDLQLDQVHSNIQTTLNNLDSQIESTISTLDLIEPFINQLKYIKTIVVANIDKLSNVLSGNTPFVFHFPPESKKMILDVTVPIPTPAGMVYIRAVITRVKIDPESAKYDIRATDNKFVLPVSDGYKNLEFVCPYKQVFEGTLEQPLPES